MKETKILTGNEEDIKVAAKIICDGGTVIFPTETVYGLGANALNSEAVKGIFEAKGRPGDNPLIVHINDFCEIENYVQEVGDNAKKLAEKYWPGPMTLILKKRENIPSIVSAGLDTVGIRIPSEKIARDLIRISGLPIAAPSANLSGSPSPTSFEHVMADMYGRVDAIIQGNDCNVGVESTVIDVTGEVPVILRPGGITPEMIKEVCGMVLIDKGINGISENEKPKSPGMKYRHYAPKCKVILIEHCENIAELIDKEQGRRNKEKVVILCTRQTMELLKDKACICIGDRDEPGTIAHNLFSAFRKCDEMGYEIAIMEGIKETGIGLAVMNRARRAAK